MGTLTIDTVRERPTLSADETADFLHISSDLVYDGIHRGEIPSLKLGRKLLIPTAPLLELLGIEVTS